MSDRPYLGGPAFPVPGKVFHFEEGVFKDEAFAGMNLRDYFAAKAMQAIVTAGIVTIEIEVASRAYRLADEMIEERDR